MRPLQRRLRYREICLCPAAPRIHRRLVEDGDESAKPLLKLYDNPTLFLGTAQLGMALFGLVGGATIYFALYNGYGQFVQYAGEAWIVWAAYAVVCIVLCGIAWVFGELIPKSIGLQRAERSLKAIRPLIQPWSRLLYPLICLGNWLGKAILRGRDLEVTNEIDMAHSEDESACSSRPATRKGRSTR